MFKWLRKRKIYQQASILVAVTLAVLFLLLVVVIGQTTYTIQKQNRNHLIDMTEQIKQEVLSSYTDLKQIIQMITYDDEIQRFLLLQNDTERYASYLKLKRHLSDLSALNVGIIDIVILDHFGQRYGLSDSITYELPALELLDSQISISPRQVYQSNAEECVYLALGQNIVSIDSYKQTNQKIGELYVLVTPNAFISSKADNSSSSNTHLFLMDAENHILWSNQGGELALPDATRVNDTRSFQLSLEDLGFSILAHHGDAFNILNHLGTNSILMLCMLATLIFLVLMWVYWAKMFSAPLATLTNSLTSIAHTEMNSLNQHIELDGYQEISVISQEFNKMLQRIHALTQEILAKNTALYETELLAKQSELLHLRSQINPHFLYNTLDSMVGIAYGEGQVQIAKIAEALAIIFKYSIKGSDIVLLKDELKIAKNYVVIQQARFEERFDVTYQIDDTCLGAKVPKMILQPIIENAIVHGIEPQFTQSLLSVVAKADNKDLLLSVADNGCGMSEDVLNELQLALREPPAANSTESANSHIGIRNVHNRIRLMYGAEYGIDLTSSPQKGTYVEIRLPLFH